MNIFDFAYIKKDKSDSVLLDRIENFYVINNKQSTLKHVMSVAKTNIQIAKMYELDIEKCKISGMLHDISAVMNCDDMVLFARDRGVVLDEAEIKYPFLLHQQISQIFAREIFDVQDSDILSPINCHSTLKSNPSKYDMALFVADKLSWDQDGKPPFFKVVSDALEISLEYASLQYINFVLNENMILFPHKWLIEAKRYLEFICAK